MPPGLSYLRIPKDLEANCLASAHSNGVKQSSYELGYEGKQLTGRNAILSVKENSTVGYPCQENNYLVND